MKYLEFNINYYILYIIYIWSHWHKNHRLRLESQLIGQYTVVEQMDIINVSKQNRGKTIDVKEESQRQEHIRFKAQQQSIISQPNQNKSKASDIEQDKT